MPPSGTDETLKLEAVYLSAPIPRNLAVLTVLGAIFDKVYAREAMAKLVEGGWWTNQCLTLGSG
jgi:hypothetical protein